MNLLALSLALLCAGLEIPNASFETPNPNDAKLPAGWGTSFAQGVEHTWVDGEAHTGQRSVRVKGTDPAAMDTHVSAWRGDMPAPEPGLYYLLLWVKAEALSGPGSFRVLLRDKDKTVLKNAVFTTPGGTYDWVRLHGLLDIKPEMESLQFVLGLVRVGGTVWFDDLELRPAAEAGKLFGEATAEPPGPFPTASEQRLSVTYTVGESGLKPGGGIRLIGINWREERSWANVRDLQAVCSRDAVKLTVNRGVKAKTWPPLLHGGIFTATTEANGPALVDGDRLTVSWTLETAPVDSEAGTLLLQADTSGAGAYSPVGAPWRWALSSGKPFRLNLSATPTPLPGEDARLTICAFDEGPNPVKDFTGQVNLVVEGGVGRVPPAIEIGPDERGFKRLIVQFPKPGVYFVNGTAGQLTGRSNPIWVREGAGDRRIYFGDLHVHGECSGDAVGPQQYTHRFARDYLGLDFAALADHAPGGSSWATWEKTKQSNNDNRDTPWYDTIQGYERSFQQGHKNVYFPDNDPPFIGGQDSTALWANLDGRAALTIPHTPNTNSGVKNAKGEYVWDTMDWGPKNERYQRVVELVQTRSSYEQDAKDPDLRIKQGGFGCSVQDALALGHTMGFIGSTDTHDGKPGSKQGRAAIISPKLERRALWESLSNRSCYAVSEDRILLEFSVNGQPMGSEVTIPTPTTKRELAARVVGCDQLVRLDLIRNGKMFSSAQPNDGVAEFHGYDDESLTGRTYYYLRVIQANGQMAWASPVWVSVKD